MVAEFRGNSQQNNKGTKGWVFVWSILMADGKQNHDCNFRIMKTEKQKFIKAKSKKEEIRRKPAHNSIDPNDKRT